MAILIRGRSYSNMLRWYSESYAVPVLAPQAPCRAVCSHRGTPPSENVPMRRSQLFIPTTAGDPAEAEVTSHRLLVEGGRLHPPALGRHLQLSVPGAAVAEPCDLRSCGKRWTDRAQEFLLPALTSGRGLAGVGPLGKSWAMTCSGQGPEWPPTCASGMKRKRKS